MMDMILSRAMNRIKQCILPTLLVVTGIHLIEEQLLHYYDWLSIKSKTYSLKNLKT